MWTCGTGPNGFGHGGLGATSLQGGDRLNRWEYRWGQQFRLDRPLGHSANPVDLLIDWRAQAAGRNHVVADLHELAWGEFARFQVSEPSDERTRFFAGKLTGSE